MGVLGGLVWILFLALFLYVGVKMLLNAVDPDRTWYFIATSSFVAALYLWGMAVIYVPGAMLIMLAALCTGIMLAARNAIEPHREHEISLVGNKRSGFLLVSAVMLVVIFSLGSLYTVGRHYASAYVFARGELALQKGDVATAKARTNEAYSLMTDDRYLRRLAEIEYADLKQVLSLPADTPNFQARLSDAFRSSITHALQAAALNGTDANNLGMLGAIYGAVVPLKIDGVYYDRAKEALTKARALDPQNPIRTLMLARLAFSNGNVDDARKLMNEAIRQKPDYVDATFMLSQLEIAAGNIDAAIVSTVSTIRLEPQNPARFFQLGVLYLAKKDTESGTLALQEAVRLDPQYANARYYLAFAYDKLDKRDAALEQLRKILETNPGNPDVQKLIDRLNAGEKITDPVSQSAPSNNDVTTKKEDTKDRVVKDPNSPLLTPVNPVPKKDTTTQKTTSPAN